MCGDYHLHHDCVSWGVPVIYKQSRRNDQFTHIAIFLQRESQQNDVGAMVRLLNQPSKTFIWNIALVQGIGSQQLNGSTSLLRSQPYMYDFPDVRKLEDVNKWKVGLAENFSDTISIQAKCYRDDMQVSEELMQKFRVKLFEQHAAAIGITNHAYITSCRIFTRLTT